MPDTAIIAHLDRLTIEHLTIQDPDVADSARHVAEQGRDLNAWAASAMSVGARAIGIADASREALQIRSGLDRLSTSVSNSVTEALTRTATQLDQAAALSSERVGTAVEQQINRLALGIQSVLRDTDGGVRSQVEAAIRDGIIGLRTALHDDGESTRMTVASGLAELRAIVAVDDARTQLINSTHLKGMPFEERIRAALEGLAGPMGLLVEDTTLIAGEVPRAKTGDFVLCQRPTATAGVVAVAPAQRIAVEVKSGARLTSARWQRLLADSARNRGATCALGVVPSSDVLDGQLLMTLGPTSAVVVFDPDVDDPNGLLAAVIGLLRAGALGQDDAASNARGADRVALRTAAENVVRAAEGLAPVIRQAAALRKSTGDLYVGLDAARTDLADRIGDLQRLLAEKAAVPEVRAA